MATSYAITDNISNLMTLVDEPAEYLVVTDDLSKREADIAADVRLAMSQVSDLIETISRVCWGIFDLLHFRRYEELRGESGEIKYKSQDQYLNDRLLPATGLARSTVFKYLRAMRVGYEHGVCTLDDLIAIGGPMRLVEISNQFSVERGGGKVIGPRGQEPDPEIDYDEKVTELVETMKSEDKDIEWKKAVSEAANYKEPWVSLDMGTRQVIFNQPMFDNGTEYCRQVILTSVENPDQSFLDWVDGRARIPIRIITESDTPQSLQ